MNEDLRILLDQLRDGNRSPFQRRASLLRLADDHPRGLLEALRVAAEDADRTLRREVARLAARAPQAQGEALLLDLLKDDEADVRAEAARSLAEAGSEQSAGSLKMAEDDPSPTVRSAAARSLRRLEERGLVLSFNPSRGDQEGNAAEKGGGSPWERLPGSQNEVAYGERTRLDDPELSETSPLDGEAKAPPPSLREEPLKRGDGPGPADRPPAVQEPPEAEDLFRVAPARRYFDPTASASVAGSSLRSRLALLVAGIAFAGIFSGILYFVAKDVGKPARKPKKRYYRSEDPNLLARKRKKERERAEKASAEVAQARAAMARGDYRKAHGLAASAYRRAKGNWRAHGLAGTCLFCLGDAKGAAYHYRSAGKMNPPGSQGDRLYVLQHVAGALSGNRSAGQDEKEALAAVERLYFASGELLGPVDGVRADFLLGAIYALQGKRDEALRFLAKALKPGLADVEEHHLALSLKKRLEK